MLVNSFMVIIDRTGTISCGEWCMRALLKKKLRT